MRPKKTLMESGGYSMANLPFEVINSPIQTGVGELPEIRCDSPYRILGSRIDESPTICFERLFQVGECVYSVRFWDASGLGDWMQGIRRYD